MKKICFVIGFFVFFSGLVFCDTDERVEVDFLLFLPNSSNRFVFEEQANVQLDNLAGYLINRRLSAGQIFVHGYTAFAVSDVDPIDLSRGRALFVINELQRRGVPGYLFSDPLAFGSVDFWGSNIDEENRIQNRRVRILIDGTIITPQIIAVAEPQVIYGVEPVQAPIQRPGFPWMILLPLLLFPLAFILFMTRKKPAEKPKPAAAVLPAAKSEIIVNLEEEIRFRAFEHHLQHCDQYVDVDKDWYEALPEICARYEALGYEVYTKDGIWFARKFS